MDVSLYWEGGIFGQRRSEAEHKQPALSQSSLKASNTEREGIWRYMYPFQIIFRKW